MFVHFFTKIDNMLSYVILILFPNNIHGIIKLLDIIPQIKPAVPKTKLESSNINKITIFLTINPISLLSISFDSFFFLNKTLKKTAHTQIEKNEIEIK